MASIVKAIEKVEGGGGGGEEGRARGRERGGEKKESLHPGTNQM